MTAPTAYGVPTNYTRTAGFVVVPGRTGKGEARWVAVRAALHSWTDSAGTVQVRLIRDDQHPITAPRATYHRALLEALAAKCGPLLFTLD